MVLVHHCFPVAPNSDAPFLHLPPLQAGCTHLKSQWNFKVGDALSPLQSRLALAMEELGAQAMEWNVSFGNGMELELWQWDGTSALAMEELELWQWRNLSSGNGTFGETA
jgi:hypothetical protein